jgi:hypothetical protein
MRSYALASLTMFALLCSSAASAEEEVQALVVPLFGQVAEEDEPRQVAVPGLADFLSEVGIRSTSDLARTDPESLARDLGRLEVVEIDKSRESHVTLRRRYRTTPLARVHEVAPMAMAQLLVLGAEEMPAQTLTPETMERLIEIGGRRAAEIGPLRW